MVTSKTASTQLQSWCNPTHLVEALRHKVVKQLAPLPWLLLQAWRSFPDDHEDDTQRVHLPSGRRQLRHLYRTDAQRPHINLQQATRVANGRDTLSYLGCMLKRGAQAKCRRQHSAAWPQAPKANWRDGRKLVVCHLWEIMNQHYPSRRPGQRSAHMLYVAVCPLCGLTRSVAAPHTANPSQNQPCHRSGSPG